MTSSWTRVIPAADRAVYEAAGYGRQVEPGETPAVLVVDVTYGFTGKEPMPILQSIAEYPNSCGFEGWRAIAALKSVLPRAREVGVPIIYTTGTANGAMIGRWRDKHPRTLAQPDDAHTIVREIAPEDSDIVFRKTKPSAFHGTPLLDALIERRIDTLIITGGTTSGCIRATVVDAFSCGYRVIVNEDAVFDRGELSHAVNLFDMHQKYASIQTVEETLKYLDAVRGGQT